MSALSRTLSSERLRAMLESNYKRVDLKTVCAQTTQASTHPNLAVWVHESPMWVRLSDDSVRQLWQANAKTRSRSFCHFISRDLLQLTSQQYANIKRSLEHTESEELMGIYQASKDTNDAPYALVLDFPPTSAMNRNLLLGGAALTGALTVGGVVARVASRKSKPAVGSALPDSTAKSQLDDLQRQIDAKKRELMGLDKSIRTVEEKADVGEAKGAPERAEIDELRTQNAQLSAELQRLKEATVRAVTAVDETSSVDAVGLNAALIADNRQLKNKNEQLEVDIANIKQTIARLTSENELLANDREKARQLAEYLAEENRQLQANNSVFDDLPELDVQDVAPDKYSEYKRSIDKELAQLADLRINSIGDVREVINQLLTEKAQIEQSRQDIVNQLKDVFPVNDFEDLKAAVLLEKNNIAKTKAQDEDLRQLYPAVATAVTTGLYTLPEIEGLLDKDSAPIVKHALFIASQYPDEMVAYMANMMQIVKPVIQALMEDPNILDSTWPVDQDAST
jgi:hypothetical protein